MKSVHNKSEQPKAVEWRFPCLGVTEIGLIVLFSESKIGVKLTREGFGQIGYYSESWDMVYFKPLPSTESITLRND
jgi:hypothetical protein